MTITNHCYLQTDASQASVGLSVKSVSTYASFFHLYLFGAAFAEHVYCYEICVFTWIINLNLQHTWKE